MAAQLGGFRADQHLRVRSRRQRDARPRNARGDPRGRARSRRRSGDAARRRLADADPWRRARALACDPRQGRQHLSHLRRGGGARRHVPVAADLAAARHVLGEHCRGDDRQRGVQSAARLVRRRAADADPRQHATVRRGRSRRARRQAARRPQLGDDCARVRVRRHGRAHQGIHREPPSARARRVARAALAARAPARRARARARRRRCAGARLARSHRERIGPARDDAVAGAGALAPGNAAARGAGYGRARPAARRRDHQRRLRRRAARTQGRARRVRTPGADRLERCAVQRVRKRDPQRARLHAGRHDRDRAPAARSARSEIRTDHRARPRPRRARERAAAHLRAVLPHRLGAHALERRHRPWPCDRAPRGRMAWRAASARATQKAAGSKCRCACRSRLASVHRIAYRVGAIRDEKTEKVEPRRTRRKIGRREFCLRVLRLLRGSISRSRASKPRRSIAPDSTTRAS